MFSHFILQEALSLYNRNGSLKHMISKIRRDPQAFERYQHNRDLVMLVNLFADSLRDLPRGWETKFDRNGKVKGLIIRKTILCGMIIAIVTQTNIGF
jgi:hypothetical protein